MYRFLGTCSIVYPLQFGFRGKHSTLHAKIAMTETIKEAIDNCMFGCAVFINLQKAVGEATIMEIKLYGGEAKLEHKKQAITREVEWKGNTGSVLRTDYR